MVSLSGSFPNISTIFHAPPAPAPRALARCSHPSVFSVRRKKRRVCPLRSWRAAPRTLVGELAPCARGGAGDSGGRRRRGAPSSLSSSARSEGSVAPAPAEQPRGERRPAHRTVAMARRANLLSALSVLLLLPLLGAGECPLCLTGPSRPEC